MCNPMIAVAAITAASTIASSAITAKAQKKQNQQQPQEVKNESITDQVAKTANTVDNPTTTNKKQNLSVLNTKPSFQSSNPINSGAYIENSLGFDKLGLNIGG